MVVGESGGGGRLWFSLNVLRLVRACVCGCLAARMYVWSAADRPNPGSAAQRPKL